jgi:hypothetical protein
MIDLIKEYLSLSEIGRCQLLAEAVLKIPYWDRCPNLVNRVGSLVGFILWKGYSFISLQGKTPHREGFPARMPLYLPAGDGI